VDGAEKLPDCVEATEQAERREKIGERKLGKSAFMPSLDFEFRGIPKLVYQWVDLRKEIAEFERKFRPFPPRSGSISKPLPRFVCYMGCYMGDPRKRWSDQDRQRDRLDQIQRERSFFQLKFAEVYEEENAKPKSQQS